MGASQAVQAEPIRVSRGRSALNFSSRVLDRTFGGRSTVLDRVRFLFLLFFVFNVAVSAFFLLRDPRQSVATLFASYGLTYLVLWATWTYVRNGSRAWLDAIAGLALFAAGLEAFGNPIRGYLLFYGALLFRALFGRARSVTLMTILFLAGMIASAANQVLVGNVSPLDLAQVLVNVPGFTAAAWLIHSVKVALHRYIEALRREQVLVESGDRLAAAQSRDDVFEAAVEGADSLAETAAGHSAGMSMGTTRVQRLVATARPTRLESPAPEARATALPPAMQEALSRLKPATASNPAAWPNGGAEAPAVGWSAAAPLLIEAKMRGLLWISAKEPLPPEFMDGFARLSASVSLALERVTLADEVRRQTEKVKASEARFRSLVQNSSDVISLLDEQGRITYISPAVEKLLGYDAGELLDTRLWRIINPEDLKVADTTFQGLLRQRGGQERLSTRWRHKDGSYRFVETVLSNQLGDPDVSAVVLNTRDVTDQKSLEDQLRQMAYYDSLTKLANRVLFKDRVARSLAYHRDSRGRLAVLFLDVDDFKHVNDSLGHAAGDDLLKAVAARLQECVGPSDTVARFGGDEFAVLVDNIAEEGFAIAVAERIQGAFRLPVTVGGLEMVTPFSIGIAISSPESNDPEELLRNADVAMYRAKGRGKRTYEVFETSMHAAALERLEMEHDLRQAIEHGALTVQYQPIVWIDSGQLSGVEALVRWSHPTKGVIAPDRFIPLAEETGLIVPLGMFVLERACTDAAAWEAAYPDMPLRLGVNLSVRQLGRPTIATEIRQVLKNTGISPERVTLEITESAVMREGEETAEKLQRLRAAGLKIAIDDFGTGYSSLSYLARFPIDMIKIDKAFVRQVGRGAKNSALLRAIVGLGHSLGVEIVAEGIETAAQIKVLEPLGCRGQGYAYSKPVTAERIMELIAEPSLRAPEAPHKQRDGRKRTMLELLEGAGN